ncbi:MAG: ABC transporter substrate-binding protein [Methanospirillum sp.]
MQRKFLGLLVLLLVGCVLLAGCTGSAPAKNNTTNSTNVSGLKDTYIIGIDNAYQPYSYQEKDGSFTGFDVESARWIANKTGFKVEFLPVAWDGIIPALQAKKIDMVYGGMTITEERKGQVAFSKPYLKINQSVAVRSDSALTFGDIMAGKAKIGVQRGTTGETEIQKLVDAHKMPASNLTSFDNFPLAITALNNKQVDAAVYDKPSMLAAIAGQNAKIVGEIDTSEEYGIAIRKDDTVLLATMNKGLDELMADPYWNQLKAKYNLTGV